MPDNFVRTLNSQNIIIATTIIIIIIIIIICDQLGLDRPGSASSNIPAKVYQVVFVHSVYSSALVLPSCCCAFLLHVVAKLIRIFLVSSQLVLLAPLPKFVHSFCGLLLKTFISNDLNHFLSCFGGGGSKFRFIQKNGKSQCSITIQSCNFLYRSSFKID
jgi:hypothetical protein